MFETQQPIEVQGLAELEILFTDSDWWMQEKLDGERRLVVCTNGDLTSFSRKGHQKPLPAKVRALMPLGTYTLDGELVGDDFTAFDIICNDGEDVRHFPYDDRLTMLKHLGVAVVRTACCERGKRRLQKEIWEDGGEGVVFKLWNACYQHGYTPAQMKAKNWLSDTFKVVDADGRGIEIATLDGKPAGRCPGYAEPGEMVEVRYQEITENGKLRHPVLLRVRDDV